MKSSQILPISVLLIFLLCSFTSNVPTPKSYKKAIKKHRKTYKKDFIKENGPLKKEDLKYLSFFPADQNYEIKTTFKRTPDEQPFDMITSSGSRKQYVKFGEMSFEINGQQQTLSIYQSLALVKMPKYRDYLFIPFKDATSGDATYGGGRYLDIKLGAVKNDHVVIDFNKAYNPYCAYTDGYNCPIPPKENHLTVKIMAGEKNYGKH